MSDVNPTAPGVLARWQAEVRVGRSRTNYDQLWRAASAQRLGDELAALGLPSLAERYYADAAEIFSDVPAASRQQRKIRKQSWLEWNAAMVTEYAS